MARYISREEHLENKNIIVQELQNHPKRVGLGLLKLGREADTGNTMDRPHWRYLARMAQHNPDQFHEEVAKARKLGIGVRQGQHERRNRE
jgi:DNA-binding IclR family transcriptional regulator